MSDRPPFDAVRASFYLIAAIIATHCLVVLVGVVFCALHDSAARCSDLRGQLGELLSGALAAALAFAGGNMRKDK